MANDYLGPPPSVVSVLDKAPEVVTLCGSTRFKEWFERENQKLTLQGKIVLGPGVYIHSEGVFPAGEKIKVGLDELHLRKIDISQRIHVINVGGYIGSSTKAEVEYAAMRGKEITYLEEGWPYEVRVCQMCRREAVMVGIGGALGDRAIQTADWAHIPMFRHESSGTVYEVSGWIGPECNPEAARR